MFRTIPTCHPRVGHRTGETDILCKLLALACLAVFCAPAMSQTPADIEAARRQSEVMQRLEQERLRQDVEKALPAERSPSGIDTRTLTPKPDASSVGQGCHPIREIVINGAPNLPETVRAQIRSDYLNRCLGVAEIEAILGEITKSYVVRGYVAARAYLPAQNLTSGRLEITVIEGKVSSIRIEDGNRDSVSTGNVLPLVEGRVLNLRDLEQGIDQINRLASNNARLDIEPGSAPGESVIVIHNEPKRPAHASLGYDNQGEAATGRYQTGLTLSLDNPLRLNDFIAITHRETTPGDQDRKFSGSDSLSYNIPFGYTTASFGSSRSKYASTLILPSGLELISTGNTTIEYLKADRVVYRDQSNRASTGVTLTAKESNNYLGGQLLQVASRKLALLDVDASLVARLGSGVCQLDAGIAEGLNAMGALNDPADLPDSSPHAQFRKYKLGFNYSLPFAIAGHELLFTSQLAAQHAEDALYGSEQLLIGSLYTVRGFVRNTLSGDNGYYWRSELSFRFPLRIGDETVGGRTFIAYDQGEVSNRALGTPAGRLIGSALGFSFTWAGANWEWFVTRPLSGPSWMNLEATQTWFRVSHSM